jgi:hypothetical protein
MAWMRKLIVTNFLTLDGYYESTNKTFDRFFDYFLEDYGTNEAFDEYNTELLRNADTLITSRRTFFLANKQYWTSYPITPTDTAIRREFAELIHTTEKYVVSNTCAATTSTRRSPHSRRAPVSSDAHAGSSAADASRSWGSIRWAMVPSRR